MGGFSEPPGTYRNIADPARMIGLLNTMGDRQTQQAYADALFQQRFQDIAAQSEKEANAAVSRTIAETAGIAEKDVPIYESMFPGVAEIRQQAVANRYPQMIEQRTGLLAPLGLGRKEKSIYQPPVTPGVYEGATRTAVQSQLPAIREQLAGYIKDIVQTQPELLGPGITVGNRIARGPIVHPSAIPGMLKEVAEVGQAGIKTQKERQEAPLDVRIKKTQAEKGEQLLPYEVATARAQATKAKVEANVSVATQQAEIQAKLADSEYKRSMADLSKLNLKYRPEEIALDKAIKTLDRDQKAKAYQNSIAADAAMSKYRDSVASGSPDPTYLEEAMTYYGFQGAQAIRNTTFEQQKAVAQVLDATVKARLTLHEAANSPVAATDPNFLSDLTQKQNRMELHLARLAGSPTVQFWGAPTRGAMFGGKQIVASVEVPTEFATLMLTGDLQNRMQTAEPPVQNVLAALQILVQRPYLMSEPNLLDETVNDYFKPDANIFPLTVDPAMVKQLLAGRLRKSTRQPTQYETPMGPSVPENWPGGLQP